MAQLLDLIYSVAVGLVAIVGVACVLSTAGVEDERSWPNLLLASVTAVFLAALVWSLAVDPIV